MSAASLKRIWMQIAHAIGNVQARVLMILFYFIIVTPFGLGVRFFSDRLGLRKRDQASWWVARPPRGFSLEEGRKQF